MWKFVLFAVINMPLWLLCLLLFFLLLSFSVYEDASVNGYSFFSMKTSINSDAEVYYCLWQRVIDLCFSGLNQTALTATHA